MGDLKVTGLRSAEFQVPDLKLATKFYEENWGLEVAAADRDTVYLRGTGTAHHAPCITRRWRKKLLAVNLAADNKTAVDGLYEGEGLGASVEAPEELGGPAGGYGFVFHISAWPGLPNFERYLRTRRKTGGEGPSCKDQPCGAEFARREAQSSEFIDLLGDSSSVIGPATWISSDAAVIIMRSLIRRSTARP